MTTPRYPQGCSGKSKARGVASSPGDYAWNVNFGNGNANYNHQDNNGFVRAVRSSECPKAVAFRDLYIAWREARRGKKASHNQLAFENRWIDGLLELEVLINAGAWRPRRPTCFIATRPKAREIHAPDFSDRIVHHWLVPQLERIYERLFIHDSYSNRIGKGTHAAVDRLRDFARQVESGEGSGWYLQLDIHNFFNSIHRPTLYAQLKRRMAEQGLPGSGQRIVHALLRHSPIHDGVIEAFSPAERMKVPAHKRLANAAPGCGIAIGNLSSQFFANVYLNALDQFVKHELHVKRYLRYVDDFILIHRDREQLIAWQGAIERFLAEHLKLSLKQQVKLRPLSAGVDFLGYIVFPTHTFARRRVIQHAREKLEAWAAQHLHGNRFTGIPVEFRELSSVWASYLGHFSHATDQQIVPRFLARFPWLQSVLTAEFDYRVEDRCVSIPVRGAA